MISDNAAAIEANELNQAIHALKPEMRRLRLIGGAVVLATVILCIIATRFVVLRAAEPFEGVMWSLGIAAFLIIATFTQIRRRHEMLVMPVLARTAGLTYEKGGRDLIDSLPQRLLPRGRTKVDDALSGLVGGRSIRFGEVKVETGGKHSTTLFDGLVISFPLKSDVPDFFIADEKATKGFLFFVGQIKVDDLVWQRSTSGHLGQSYSLWAPQSLGDHQDRLVPLLNAISTIERNLDHTSALYTASCTNRTIHLAIRHRQNLFKIGGLLSGDEELTSDLRHALHELHLPLRLVTDLLKAEQDYAAKPGSMPTASASATG